MNELTAALKEELNVDTAFTLPIFGGIDIPESIAVSWGIMAFLVIVSILLTVCLITPAAMPWTR